MAAPAQELSPAVSAELYKLQKHDGYFATGSDPHGTGMRMANRYHMRFVSLGYILGRCVMIVQPYEGADSVLMGVLASLATTKRNIKDMVQNNLLLCNAPPSGRVPETISEVPREKMCRAVRDALDQLVNSHTVRPGRVDETYTPPVWRLDSLYDEFRKIAEDLAIDSYAFPMRDTIAVSQLVEQLTDCWVEFRTLFAVRPHEK